MKKRNFLLASLLVIVLVACNNSTTNQNTSSLYSSEEKMDETKIETILQNTLALKEVAVKSYYVLGNSYEDFYVEEGLIYEKINDEETYIYAKNNQNYKLFIKDGDWAKENIDDVIEYNLGYYLTKKYDFDIKSEIEKDSIISGEFNGREAYTITTNNDIKMSLVINEINDILDGFLVYDENNNISYQYSFTLGKQNYQIPSPIIELSGKFGEKEELYMVAEKGYVFISYYVYDEEGNDLYWFYASCNESIKYGEAKELTITDVGGWNHAFLVGAGSYALPKYYQETRTVIFTFNIDNTFTFEMLSVDEIVEWYESNVGMIVTGFFGEQSELYLDAFENAVSIRYDVYDEEENYLYTIYADAQESIKYGEAKELTISYVDGINFDVVGFYEADIIYRYYEKPRTLTFTFNRDKTFIVDILSVDEIVAWYESNVGIVRTGYFGERDELFLNATENSVSIDYIVFDEEGNRLYFISASAESSIKYGEAKELTITYAGNWYLNSLNEKEKIAVPAYYEEPRTLTFTFNKDQTFTVDISSTDEMITWYENNVGLLINGCFGEREELILSTIEEEGNVSITYSIYDEEGNYLYMLDASAELNLEYGKKIELTITDAFSYDANYFYEERYTAISAYYEEPRTLMFTFNEDNTFTIEMASTEEIFEWYNSQII